MHARTHALKARMHAHTQTRVVCGKHYQCFANKKEKEKPWKGNTTHQYTLQHTPSPHFHCSSAPTSTRTKHMQSQLISNWAPLPPLASTSVSSFTAPPHPSPPPTSCPFQVFVFLFLVPVWHVHLLDLRVLLNFWFLFTPSPFSDLHVHSFLLSVSIFAYCPVSFAGLD